MASRRTLLGLGAAALGAAAIGWYASRGEQWPDPGPTLKPSEALQAASAGKIVLIDIRRPEEWRETGVPRGAHPITMHQDTRAFVVRVRALAGDPAKPVALICHSGYRSSLMRAELERQGFASVTNVAEGVAGGRYGAGWVRGGLPLDQIETAR